MASSPLLGRPSAFIPIVMSALALVVVALALYCLGPAPRVDEGAAAHLWQLLIAGQIPLVAFFAMKWLPRCTPAALIVLGLQACALLAALAPVYLLHW